MRKHLSLCHSCLLNHGEETHPENATRLASIIQALSESPYQPFLDLSCARLATEEELCLVHDPVYVKHVLSLEGKNASIDHETLVSPGSIRAALVAAGIGIELVEQVLKGKIQNGFALVRPPGHHARPDGGMGFCIFNNIAIAAKKAFSKEIKRILILDWDVHHGNGTQDAFYDDERVLQIDLHQDNLFPSPSGLLRETGKGKGKGFTVNVPLPPSCNDADYVYIFENLVKPLARHYRPELILVSAGFDAHESDPLGFMNLTTAGYGRLTAEIKALAEELCQGKLVFFLEGGYNPYWLTKNVVECVGVLAQESVSITKDNLEPHSHGIGELIKEIYESRRST